MSSNVVHFDLGERGMAHLSSVPWGMSCQILRAIYQRCGGVLLQFYGTAGKDVSRGVLGAASLRTFKQEKLEKKPHIEDEEPAERRGPSNPRRAELSWKEDTVLWNCAAANFFP